MNELTMRRKDEAIGDAEQELTMALVGWFREQQRQGLDLPEGFEERAALALAERSRDVLDRLAFRCVTAGLDACEGDLRPPGTRITPVVTPSETG